ncbi:cystinosin-like [Ornithodoros turicata]|uniref:cystinosin-like n=1 Tax=Ornithodoros turicata TaxID=34597 RepID=UPI0031391041
MLFWWTFLLWAIARRCDGIVVQSPTHDLALKVHQKGSFEVVISSPVKQTIQVTAELTKSDVVEEIVPVNLTVAANSTEKVVFDIRAKDPGHVVVILHSKEPDVDMSRAFVRVSVNKNSHLAILSAVVGWLYFLAWSVSFYPQIYINWRRQSVVGLNFDYVGLNITGFLCYTIYNCGLYFAPKIQEEYLERHPFGIIPVELNDVVFAVHGSAITAVTIVQCAIYERGMQKVSTVTTLILICIWSGAIISVAVMAFERTISSSTLLSCTYYFSYAKLAATLVKYIPQAYLNYQRQSTEGWSIGNVILDFLGGILSIMQMIIIAYNYNDWTSIFGNFTKFGLGVVSVVFDVLFMMQHYVLYWHGPVDQQLRVPADSPYTLVSGAKRK